MSFLSWRLIKSKLPFTNNGVCRFVDMPVDCLCFTNTQPETIQHFFFGSDPAKNLWKFVGQPLGINYRSTPGKVFLNDWWQTKPKNEPIVKRVSRNKPIAGTITINFDGSYMNLTTYSITINLLHHSVILWAFGG